MRESFSEYKKNLEGLLDNINYLYSGDVIYSEERSFCEYKNSPLTSPKFIVNSINNIYKESFDIMFKNSTEVILPKEAISSESNIIEFISSKVGHKFNFLFCSDRTKKLLGINKNLESIKSLPSYFYSIDRYVGLNLDVFFCPLIVEGDGEMVMYVVDNAIQSLVYSIQNMDYLISQKDETKLEWEHKMIYNFYYCQYKSTKIVIRNVSKIREIKINEILNGN